MGVEIKVSSTRALAAVGAIIKMYKVFILSYRNLTTIPEDLIEPEHVVNLREVYLNNNRLVVPPIDVLSKLVNLQSLSLECNNLKHIPDEIGLLSQLRYLNVSFNPIICLPSTIAKLVKLEEVWLRSCYMTEFPLILTELVNIKRLSLAGNDITYVPYELISLKKLNWLSLNNNRINSLPVCMQELGNLNVLLLESNAFTEIPRMAVNMSGLQTLNLRYNRIVSVPNDFANWLITACKFIKLDLRDNFMILSPEMIAKPWHLKEYVLVDDILECAS